MSELHDYLRTRLRGPEADTTLTRGSAHRGVLTAVMLAERGGKLAYVSTTYNRSVKALTAAVRVCDSVHIPVHVHCNASDTRLDFDSGGVIRFLPANAKIEKVAGLEFTSVFVEEMGHEKT